MIEAAVRKMAQWVLPGNRQVEIRMGSLNTGDPPKLRVWAYDYGTLTGMFFDRIEDFNPAKLEERFKQRMEDKIAEEKALLEMYKTGGGAYDQKAMHQ